MKICEESIRIHHYSCWGVVSKAISMPFTKHKPRCRLYSCSIQNRFLKRIPSSPRSRCLWCSAWPCSCSGRCRWRPNWPAWNSGPGRTSRGATSSGAWCLHSVGVLPLCTIPRCAQFIVAKCWHVFYIFSCFNCQGLPFCTHTVWLYPAHFSCLSVNCSTSRSPGVSTNPTARFKHAATRTRRCILKDDDTTLIDWLIDWFMFDRWICVPVVDHFVRGVYLGPLQISGFAVIGMAFLILLLPDRILTVSYVTGRLKELFSGKNSGNIVASGLHPSESRKNLVASTGLSASDTSLNKSNWQWRFFLPIMCWWPPPPKRTWREKVRVHDDFYDFFSIFHLPEPRFATLCARCLYLKDLEAVFFRFLQKKIEISVHCNELTC